MATPSTKIYLFLLINFINIHFLTAQNEDFYYYYPSIGKIHLDVSTEKMLVKFETDVPNSEQISLLQSTDLRRRK